MKAKIELNFLGERIFLNYWNWLDGNDVICEIVNGKLMLNQYDEESNELQATEVTIVEFIDSSTSSLLIVSQTLCNPGNLPVFLE